MYQLDFHKPCYVHFIGIGGISMSGLAEVLLNEGFKVSGSDARESELTGRLREKGAEIFIGQKASNLNGSINLIVYTAAIHQDNPEYMEGLRLAIPMLSRAEFLGQLMRNYNHAIAVAGTHGKTTTTSMLAQILVENQLDPTVSLGGMLNSIGGNIRIGESELFLTEACEYTNSFLSFYPTTAIILNVKEDHLDFFKDLADIRNSFSRFAARVPDSGTLIINDEVEDYQMLVKAVSGRVITFGFKAGSDYQASAIAYDNLGRASYNLAVFGEDKGRIVLGVPGEHNVLNSLAAIAAALKAGASLEGIRPALRHFTGTKRRFEIKGEFNGITVIDDYAHHPDEIEVTLKAARNYPHKKLWCVFQPHTYTRTKAFMDEFAKALSQADEVIMAEIFPARETDTLGVSSMDLAEKIEKLGTKACYFSSFNEIEKYILKNCQEDELLITMGAGDVVIIGESLLGR